jgi:hypothetical protein
MPFALLMIGIVLVIAGIRNTQDDLFALVKGDFTGQANFIYWVISILIIGAVGYVPKLKPVSTGFLVLVILVLFLKRGDPKGVGGGFFEKFTAALNITQQPASLAGVVPGIARGTGANGPATQNLLDQLKPLMSLP